MTVDIAPELAPLVKRLANKIKGRYPKTRLFFVEGDRVPNRYYLYVLNAPRDVYDVLTLVSDDMADIGVDYGYDILVMPYAKGKRPAIDLEGPEGERLAVEIKPES